MAFDRNAFHREAIQIPTHEDVSEMREFLIETVSDEGCDVEIDDAGNVLSTRISGGNNRPHIVLNTHIDTVPPHVPYDRDGDIVRGRGACDAKGPLASLLEAFLSATTSKGQLTLAITPNEETSQIGGAHLGKTISADGYIVGEPTDLDVCIGAKGNFGGEVTVYGESAHASNPSAGSNPLQLVGPLIDALQRYDDDCGPDEHELLGKPTLVPTRVKGGGPVNQVPDKCTITFDRRTIPPVTIDKFIASLRSYLDQRLPNEASFEVKPAYPDSPSPDAFATDRGGKLVQTLAEISGGEIRPFEAATEASYFAHDAPAVVFGPGVLFDAEGPVAHAEREYVSSSAVADASEIVREAVETLLS